jgi:hypothetical protein
VRLNEVDGFDIKDLIMAKFTDSKWVQDFLDGKIYMNNFNHFIEQEKKTKEKGQGDSYEAAHVIEFKNAKFYDQDGNLLITAKSGNLVERYKGIKEVPLFCTALFNARDFKVLEQGEDSISCKLDITEEEKLEFINVFKSDVVALTFSPGVFVRRFIGKTKTKDPDLQYGSVDYVDFSIMDKKRKEAFDAGTFDFLFHKHHSLDYQREYRFIMPNISSKDPYVHEIGKIDDLFNVLTVEQFFDGMIQLSFKKEN